ncbi:hypothetical protein HAX54_052456, partial [Datura stramonium]|nr:hypothetical protein [Datura stramonium]
GVIPEARKKAKGRSTAKSRPTQHPSGDVATMNGFSMLEDLTYHIEAGQQEGADY